MAYTTADIRNVCLLGPAEAGKTQLAEALLYAGGAISQCGQVASGNTVADYRERERAIGHSLYPAVCHTDHAGIHVNVVDTPGYRDFYGRALAVLPAVETAVIVINAEKGIEEMTRRMMEAAAAQHLCRMIVINKIDSADADLAGLVGEIQETFGGECLPINLPASHGDGVVDCFFHPSGGETVFGSVAEAHTCLIDQVVEVDDELMELYLEQGEDRAREQLPEPFEQALREGHLIPVCFASALTGIGVAELLDVFERLMPNPEEGNPPEFLKGEGSEAEPVSVVPDPDQHVVAHVVEKEVVTPISHYICSDQIRKGDLITIDVDQDEFVFMKETGVTSWDELESLGPFPEAKWAKEDLGVRDDGGEKNEIREEAAQVLAQAGSFPD